MAGSSLPRDEPRRRPGIPAAGLPWRRRAAVWQDVAMFHLVLSLPLLTAQPMLLAGPGPVALGAEPPQLEAVDPFANALRLREVAAGEAGVLVAHAGLIGLVLQMRDVLPAGNPKDGPFGLRSSRVNWVIPGIWELLFPPLLGTLSAWLASGPVLAGGLVQALAVQGLVRVLVDVPGQAAFALALFGGSPALGFLGLGLMLLADELGTPLAASWGLHHVGPVSPPMLAPEPPMLQSPPQVRGSSWILPLTVAF
jgi:hypothetical protein